MSGDERWRLDPELAAIAVLIPEFDLSDVGEARRLETRLMAQGRTTVPGVTTRDTTAPRRGGGEIAVRVYRPPSPGRLPAILYVHGGAFILGDLTTEEDRCELYARGADCVVVSLDYRLAPEHPFPAAFDDCLDVLLWIHDQAEALDIDPRRVAVGGNSAGGALAAAIALESRILETPPLVHQLLVNPVLDHRSVSPSMLDFTETPSWTRAKNLLMWDWYLQGAVEVDHRAAPAMAEDLSGLPSTSMWIAEYDPLRDEDYDYAARLMRHGVPVELIQYAGTIHGFDGYRTTRVGQRALADQVDTLRRAFRR